MRPPARVNAVRPFLCAFSGLSSTAVASAPRRRRNVDAHSASPPLLSPDPTTAQMRLAATPPVRAVSSRAIEIDSNAARRINAPSGMLASRGTSAARIASAEW